ncbi:MAG: response regulator transcription factor [Acidovorax sp.]|uniref:DNA-binding response regulator n=1 Tax=Acidovorax sp. TaxID=1872122 RepID=UPI0039E527B1
MPQPWHVLIVEDDPQTRDFFAASVQGCAQLALAGCLGTVAEARDWLDARAPQGLDVLLVDLGLPDGSGLDAIAHARYTHPGCEPLVISMFGDEESVLASIEAGALGYIHKDATPENIADTVLQMKAGASPISPMIARQVLHKYLDLRSNRPQTHMDRAQAAINTEAKDALDVALSPREKDVLDLIARGFSYAETARLHGVSIHTVQAHIKSLYAKLAVHSKSEAVFEATRRGLL